MKQVRKRNDDRGEGAFLCVRACVGVGDLALRVACGFGDDSLLFQPRRQVRETGEGPGRRLAGHPQGAAASDCDSTGLPAAWAGDRSRASHAWQVISGARCEVGTRELFAE